jgi:SAM-dependent MidA family methyltransferase
VESALPTWREAWTAALYGPNGFYRSTRPRDTFRTSVHASALFASAILALARRHGLRHVVDMGAGGGELLGHLHSADPSLRLTGVDLAPRPEGLPSAVAWHQEMPPGVEALLVANEWLDNVPCDVVEADDHGEVRLVHVDPVSGREELGAVVDDPWLSRWWPLRGPGSRAEVGSTRDEAWSDVLDHIGRGVAIAVDYGHTRSSRPNFGSLRSYRDGQEVDVVPDGSRDLTAHVAVDSLPQDRRCSQRDALRDLGVDATRPPLTLASVDPAGYVRALSRASQAAELTAVGGLGDFTWVIEAIGLELAGSSARVPDSQC